MFELWLQSRGLIPAARYGSENAEKISNGNALRILRSAWRAGRPHNQKGESNSVS